MGAVKEAIEAALPGVLVHSIATGASVEADVMSGYFGNVNDQASSQSLAVCSGACIRCCRRANRRLSPPPPPRPPRRVAAQ